MSSRWVTWANYLLLVWLGLGCGAMLLSETSAVAIRDQLRDAVSPTLSRVQSWTIVGRTWWEQSRKPMAEDPSTEPADFAHREEVQRLEREVFAMRELWQREKNRLRHSQNTARLFQPELIEARRLWPDQEARWKSRNWLNVGQKQQVSEQDWILSSELPLIDVGSDHELQADEILLAGRTVLGQIDRVGRWSSTYRPLTHAEFRCPATLKKPDSDRPPAEVVGSFHGTGQDLCELKYIENTQPVSPGDYVVLAQEADRRGGLLILGEVVEARVLSNSPFWEIKVRPVPTSSAQTQVEVLTERVNPHRLMSRQ